MTNSAFGRLLLTVLCTSLVVVVVMPLGGDSEGRAAGLYRVYAPALAADSARPAVIPGVPVTAPARYYASAVWDDHHDQLLVYGGLDRAVRAAAKPTTTGGAR